jgi:K+/H+ antiporter YhaU regulatory subunit KhtT
MPRRFPPPWTAEKIPDGFKVIDANGQSLTYVYSREDESSALTAGVLTEDEARRIASNMGKCQNC